MPPPPPACQPDPVMLLPADPNPPLLLSTGDGLPSACAWCCATATAAAAAAAEMDPVPALRSADDVWGRREEVKELERPELRPRAGRARRCTACCSVDACC